MGDPRLNGLQPTGASWIRTWDDFRLLLKPNGSCLEFQRTKDRYGYGQLSVRGKMYKAHRAAWLLFHGELPPRVFVLHRCDNRPCCNPDHLFLGTNADNMRDASAKGRLPAQQKTHCRQGHEYTAGNTYRPRGVGGRACRVCIGIRGKAWKQRRKAAGTFPKPPSGGEGGGK